MAEPTVAIVIRDEMTAAADRIKREFLELNREGNVSGGLGHGLRALDVGASTVGRELEASLGLMGVSVGVLSGGFVASIAAMTSALGEFSRNAAQSRYVAEEIGLTQKELYQFEYAAQSRVGIDAAKTGIEGLGRAVRDLVTYNITSETMETLKKIGGPYGAKLGLHIIDFYEKNGKSMRATMLEVLRELTEAEGATDIDTEWMHDIVARSFKLGTTGLAGITAADLSKFSGAAEDNRQQTEKLLFTLTRLDVELSQVQISLGIKLLGPMTELLRTLRLAMGGPEGTAFKQWLVDLATQLGQLPWDTMRQAVEAAMPKILAAVKTFASQDGKQVFNDLEKIFTIVGRWRGTSAQAAPHASTTAAAATAAPAASTAPQLPEWLAPPTQAAGPMPPASVTAAQDWMQDSIGRQRTVRALSVGMLKEDMVLQLDGVREQLIDLNDWLRINREGAGGGNTEGGVTLTGRNTPMDTEAGEAGGVPSGGIEDRRGDADKMGELFARFIQHPTIRGLQAIKSDANRPGQPLRTEIRKQLGIPDPGEPSPWRPGGAERDGVPLPQARPGAAPPGPADAVTRLGLERVGGRIYQYGEDERALRGAAPNPLMEQTSVGYSQPSAKQPAIFYDPSKETAGPTILHEAGHVGRETVRQAGSPNIFRRYGLGINPETSLYNSIESEERLQRALDLGTNTGDALPNRLQRSMAEGYLSQRGGGLGPSGRFGEPPSPAELGELQRHNQMIENRAQEILNERNSATLKLNINVRSSDQLENYDSSVKGDLIDNSVKFGREKQPAFAE